MRCSFGLCDGSGWLIDERTRSAEECRCMPEQRAARVAGNLRARIPREYQDASFQHTNINGLPRDAVARVRRYVDTLDERLAEGDGLWISGSIGTGKTWLAMLVARYAIERGRGVAVYSVPRLLSEIRRTYDDEGQTTLELLDQLTSVPLLVLDDAGTERTNPWVLEQLYTIINERWQEKRSIVMTTNLDAIQMEERLGERAASRLVGMCETVVLDGVDHRTGRHHIDVGPTGFDHGGRGLPAAGAGGAGAFPADRSGGPGGPPRDDAGSPDGFSRGAAGSPDGFAGEGRPGGMLGPPPALDPETAAWAAGAAVPQRREDAPGNVPADGFGAPPPPRTFGADPADLRRPERRVFDERDRRR